MEKKTNNKPKARPPIDMATVYGRIPPQAKEMEEAVLGAIMIEQEAWDTVNSILKVDSFYSPAHQTIFSAMQDIATKGQPIDTLTVSDYLEKTGKLESVGGRFFITSLTNGVTSSANAASHSRIIAQKHVAREVIKISGELITMAYEEMTDPFDMISEAEDKLAAIVNSVTNTDMVDMTSVIVESMQQIEEWRKNSDSNNGVTGIPSGFIELDQATRGFQNGDLIYLGARPSIGKTAFALNIIRNAAKHLANRTPVGSIAVWSLEMKSVRLFMRMLSAESGQLLSGIQIGRITDNDMKMIYQKGIQPLSRLNVFFDDSSGVTMQKLRAKARRLKKTKNLSLVVIDYLQLMTGEEGGNREQEIAKISRGLKKLAQELNIPIIALSQLSRHLERRTGTERKPVLADLRESGSIEQDADVVMFLFEPIDTGEEMPGSTNYNRIVSIAKQRDGYLKDVPLNFQEGIQLFENPGMGGFSSPWSARMGRSQLPAERDDPDF
jgi:replicative DNA helicase